MDCKRRAPTSHRDANAKCIARYTSSREHYRFILQTARRAGKHLPSWSVLVEVEALQIPVRGRNESHSPLLSWSPEYPGNTQAALHGIPQLPSLSWPQFLQISVSDSVTPTKTRHTQHPNSFIGTEANRNFKKRSKTC